MQEGRKRIRAHLTDDTACVTMANAFLHNVSYKPTYRANFADATRTVLRLVERHSRHSTTALNRQSLSSFSLSLSFSHSCSSSFSLVVASPLLFPPLVLSAIAVATAFYFRARPTRDSRRRNAKRSEARRRDAARRGHSRRPLSSSARSDFVQPLEHTLRSPYRARVRVSLRDSLSLSLSVYRPRSLTPSGPPQSTHSRGGITRRNLLPCRLRPALC